MFQVSSTGTTNSNFLPPLKGFRVVKVDIIFRLESLKLEVFAVKNEPSMLNPSGDGYSYFWRDPGSPQGQGPFDSPLTATRHYEYLMKVVKSSKGQESQLIRADFKAKKKLDPQI